MVGCANRRAGRIISTGPGAGIALPGPVSKDFGVRLTRSEHAGFRRDIEYDPVGERTGRSVRVIHYKDKTFCAGRNALP